MKRNKFFVLGVLAMVLAFGLLGCVTTDPNAPPPYQFDGTVWTKTEDYDFVFKGSNWQVLSGSQEVTSGNDMSAWKVDVNTLIFGNDGWSGSWGHAAGTWTLKSGTPKADTLDGTTWARTAVLELSFDNGKIFAKDGENRTGNPSRDEDWLNYTVTSKNISVKFANGNTTRGTYVVNEATLTVTSNGRFASSRLEGSSWTKK